MYMLEARALLTECPLNSVMNCDEPMFIMAARRAAAGGRRELTRYRKAHGMGRFFA